MPYNPWAGYPVTGSWADHGSYSAGGVDYPLGYGTTLVAPAAGTLRISGGSGEFAAGWVGSAGRRSILELDAPIGRLDPAESYPPEAAGPMVAVVVQHQSEFGTAGPVVEGAPMGTSGASANGADYGGDVHLHVHGLDAAGNRLDFTKFCHGDGSGPVDPGDPGAGHGNLVAAADGRLFRGPSEAGNLVVAADGRLYRGASGSGTLSVAADGHLFRAI